MNLYWSVYEAMEEETLVLADNILFNDKQLDVYSVKLGNLIIRCVIEIEALSKELYCSLGGEAMIFDEKKGANRYPYFDTECLDLLVKKWKINNKKIQVVSSKMYFNQDNSVLTPLHKSNRARDRGSLWNKAYQALKHNRTQNMDKATVRNLLNALGSLYILNLYYRNDSFWYDVPIEGKEEYRTHSKIFSPFVCDISIHLPLRNDDNLLKANAHSPFDESIYIKKYTDDSATQIRDLMYSYELDLQLQTISSDKFFTRHFVFVTLFVECINAASYWTIGINHTQVCYFIKILTNTVVFSHMPSHRSFTNLSATSPTSFAWKHNRNPSFKLFVHNLMHIS